MAPAYLQDEDEDDLLPFRRNQDDEDDTGSFATGPTSAPAGSGPQLPPPPSLNNTQAPTPELQRIIGGPAPSPTPSGNPPVTDAVNDKQAALAQTIGQRPVAPQPKWWQRALSMAAGGLQGGIAGYINSSGKRIPPINPEPGIAASTDAIMGGGKYRRDLAQWNNQVAARRADLGAAQTAQENWWKNRQLNNQEQLQQSQEQRNTAQAAYYEGRDPASVQRGTIQATEKQMENMLKGRDQYGYQKAGDPVSQGAETIQDLNHPGYVYVVSPAQVPLPAELKQYAPGYKVGQLVPWSEFKRAEAAAQQDVVRNQNKPAPPPKNPVSVAPGHTLYDPDQGKPIYTAPKDNTADQPKPPTANQMRGIEAKKNDRLNAAQAAAQRRIANGDDKDTVYAELETQKQQIQNEYEGEIQAATGNYPGHYDYAAQQGGGRGGHTGGKLPQVSEKALRAAAAAQGKNADLAVAEAKKRAQSGSITFVP